MNQRTSEHPINPVFLDRWSPRAFDGSTMSEGELLTLLEAARWAPSAFNAQPWRFHYALRDTPGWQRLLGLLIPYNAGWAEKASALVIVSSYTHTPGSDGPRPAPTGAFDAGCAWGFLALQAQLDGFVTHGMAGFDHGRAKAELGFDAHEEGQAAIAIGRVGDPATLPEALRAREMPSSRKPLSDVAVRVD